MCLRKHHHLTPAIIKSFATSIERRLRDEPIAYITKECGFFREQLYVDSNTLIPRPETEGLVELATNFCTSPNYILDLGTGSGCVAVALARYFPKAKVEAWDISKKALDVAKTNAKRYHLTNRISFFELCMLKETSWHKRQAALTSIDLIITNPPYVDMRKETDKLSDETRLFEPLLALDGGKDGLSYYESLLQIVPKYLKHSHSLFLAEFGYNQSQKLRKLCENLGLSFTIYQDLSKKDRYLMVRSPNS